MSRSRKKTPSCHIAGRDGRMKRLFSRRVRRVPDLYGIPDGGAYRKMNETWDISDWHEVGLPYESFRKKRIEFGLYEGERACRNLYEKCYLRK